MVALVEHDAAERRPALPLAGAGDHRQRMVADDDVGTLGGLGRSLDEAAAIMRAAGIDAFAAPVGQRGAAGAAEESRQPTGQVAAHHVAVAGIGRPTRHQLRLDRGAPLEAALQRILQVEQAEVVLAPLADHHLLGAHLGVGEQPARLAIQLALQRLGEGGDPHAPARRLRPQPGGGEIAQRLADAGAGFRQQHLRPPLGDARIEGARRRGGIGALAGARLGARSGQPRQLLQRLGLAQHERAGGRARRPLGPFGQAREQPALGLAGLGDARRHQLRPRPAQPQQRLRRGPRSLPRRPGRVRERLQQPLGRLLQEGRRGSIVRGRRQPQRTRQPRRRRHREAGRMDKGVEFEQVEAGKLAITQPRRHHRRVEQDHRGAAGERDRLAARRLPHLAALRDPDAAVGGVKGGNGGHVPLM